MTQEDFNENVFDYCEIDEQIKTLTKQKNVLKDKICAYMDEEGIDKAVVQGYSLTRSVSQRTTVDEDKLVTVVKGWHLSGTDGLIKTKEYVDTDVLEALTYKGLVTPTELKGLETCRKVTEVVTLRPSKKN